MDTLRCVVERIGFKTADTIATKLGFEKEKYVRLRSGLMYTLNKLSEDGHCYATREMLLEKGVELLEVEEPVPVHDAGRDDPR